MKAEFIEFIGNARKPWGQRFRNQLYVFIVCLVISVFIWTLVRLSKEYIYPVTYHVKYIDIPQNIRLTGKSDTILMLNIRVQGFDFFSERFFRPRSHLFSVSLRNVKIISRDNHLTGYLLTSGIGREIANESGYLMEIFSVSPDTLFFSFERKNLKSIPLTRVPSIASTKIKQAIDSSRILLDSLLNGSPKSDIKQTKKNK